METPPQSDSAFERQASNPWIFYGSILAFGLFLILPALLLRDLWLYMEARRAVIALELAEAGNWAVPRNLGVPVLTKPPLFYWLVAAGFRLAGSNPEWIARVPSMVAALLASLALARMLSLEFDRRTAGFGGAVLFVLPLFHWMSHMAELEMLFVGTSVLAVAAFWEVAAGTRLSRFAGPAGFFCLGLSMLAKGPVAPFTVLLTVALWTAIVRPPGLVRRLHPWLGLLLFAAPGIVWLVMLYRAGYNPAKFLSEIGYHVGEDAPHHESPLFYLDLMEEALFPWVYLWAAAALGGLIVFLRGSNVRELPGRVAAFLTRDRQQRLFIVLWFLLALAILSVIPSKRSYYAVAVMPPAAALTAMIYSALPSARRLWTARSRKTALVFAVALTVTPLALAVATVGAGAPEEWRVLDGEDRPRDQMLTGLLGVWCAGVAVLLLAAARQAKPPPFARRLALWTLAVMALLVTVHNFVVFPALNATRSHKRAVGEIVSALPSGAKVFTYHSCHDFWFYSDWRPFHHIDPRADVIDFVRTHPGVYGVTRLEDFENLLDEAGWDILYLESRIIPAEEGLVLFQFNPGSALSASIEDGG